MHPDPQVVTAAVAIVAGISGQALARRLRVPAILPLLLTGILLGPSLTGVIDPSSLGSGLRVLVGFAVAIILFEGGLSLKAESFRSAGSAIRGLVTVGALLTWAGCSLLARLFFPELGWGLAVLFGSLVIVTGPTVIQPLLHTVRPRQRIADVLRGEAILIDPIGALYAVLVLEYIVEAESVGTGHVLLEFAKRVGLGVALGCGGAGLLYAALKRRDLLARDLRNFAVVAGAIGLYALSESILSESGVLTVTLAGFLLGWLHPPGLEEVEEFKGQLTVMMVSIVFVLLSADLDLRGLLDLGLPGIGVVVGTILIVRPVTIFACTLRTELTMREKLFLSWIAPRGIVAAAVSSLFALILHEKGVLGGRDVMNLTFAVIAGTVIVQAPTARWVGKTLGVLEGVRNGVLFVGANRVARDIALALDRAGLRVTLLDTSDWRVREARELGLNASRKNALDTLEIEELDLAGIGHLIAATPNDNVNRLAVTLYAREFGRDEVRALRLSGSKPGTNADDPLYLCGERINWEELYRRLDQGQVIGKAEIDHELAVTDLGELIPGAVALFALDTESHLEFLGDGDQLPVGGVLFYVAPQEKAPEDSSEGRKGA